MKLFFALFLLAYSSIIHAMDIDSKAAGLIAVAKIDHMDITQFVLEKSPASGRALLHIAAFEHDVARAQFCLNHGEDVNVTYRKSCHNHLAKIVLNVTDTSTHLSYQQSALMEAFDGAVERNKFDTLPAIVEFLCRRGAKSSRKWCANFEQQCKRDRISNTDLEKSINIIVKALEDRCVARKTAN